MLKEFKKFAMRGNMVDMAVGIIIGAAFGKIVSSLVDNIIMPPIGMLLGRVDFSHLAIILKAATFTSPPVVIAYGVFINTIINFLIIAFSIFLVIRQMNKIGIGDDLTKITKKKCPFCDSDISIRASRCPNCTSKLD